MDATDKNLELAEVSNSDINKEEHADSSDLFPEEDSDLEYSKGEIKLKHAVDPTCNKENDTCTSTTGPGETNLKKKSESTTTTKKGMQKYIPSKK